MKPPKWSKASPKVVEHIQQGEHTKNPPNMALGSANQEPNSVEFLFTSLQVYDGLR